MFAGTKELKITKDCHSLEGLIGDTLDTTKSYNLQAKDLGNVFLESDTQPTETTGFSFAPMALYEYKKTNGSLWIKSTDSGGIVFIGVKK